MILGFSAFLLVAGCGGGAGGAGGSGGDTSTDTGSDTTSSSFAACGEGQNGDPCESPGETCEIGDECGGELHRCLSDHTWEVGYYDSVCCGETPCPDAVPNEGESCTPCYPACQWQKASACGDVVIDATCGDDWTWHLTATSSCGDCALYDTMDACNADPNCRYLTPDECNDPVLTTSGCHAKTDCSADNPCADGQTCTAVTANDTDCELPCQLCKQVSICVNN